MMAIYVGGSLATERITLAELEQYLSKAADLLRGSIDQADFKAYIFPLMFFKRISDVYAEEFAAALDKSGGDYEYAAFAENHRFAIPDGNLWPGVRNHTENIGSALQTAFREIEKANPDTLYGIFGNANWTNKDKLPDRKLADLIEHFSTKELSNANVAPDVFGNAYEYLIKRFADQSNKKAGEYYTPRSVVGLLINILDPREGETVYDPAFMRNFDVSRDSFIRRVAYSQPSDSGWFEVSPKVNRTYAAPPSSEGEYSVRTVSGGLPSTGRKHR